MHTIFYVDIGEDNLPKGEKELPIYQAVREFSYDGGCLRVYFGHVPRQLLEQKSWWQKLRHRKMRKRKTCRRKAQWPKNSWQEWLSQMLIKARELLPIQDAEDILFSRELLSYVGNENRIPEVCYSVLLRQLKEIPQRVSITIPEDAPSLLGEQICRLLNPYLSKVNYVVFIGERLGQSLWAEQYFFEEYGILSSFEKKPAKNSLWLDFEKEAAGAHKRYASENGIYHLSEAEVLKFLDTITKNGYNTKVN